MREKKFIQTSTCRCLSIEIVNSNETSDWSEQLYEAKAAELILYGRALGLSHAEAEDVLQETFFTLMQKAQPPLRPEHYCVRSFRNQALNYRRSLWRRMTRELEARSWFEKSSAQDGSERAAMHCLTELPMEQREVIVLKIWHNYTFEEIGELLDESPNTIAGRYRYGLQKMKLRLKGANYERDEFIGDPITFLAAAPPVGKA
jgi:RNA polymerase sigma-70 factor (ECF subfamily)